MNRILAIKLRQLGDTALWTAALSALREYYPEARLEVLVPESCAPLLEGHPAVDVIHSFSKFLPIKLLHLRRQRFDLVLGFHATTSLVRYAGLLGAHQSVLHHHSLLKTPRGSSFKLPRPGALEDAIARDFQVLEGLGYSGEIRKSKLYVTASEIEWARSQLRGTKKYLAMLPGARSVTRRYPLDVWLKTLDEIVGDRNVLPVVIVDPKLSEDWDLKSICHSRGIQLFDNVSLRQMLALLSQCYLAVGNDSGPIHIAAALGLRTLTFFGPGCVGDWAPYRSEMHKVLRVDVDCRAQGPRDREQFQYCTLTQCSHLSCLRKISPLQVVQALQTLKPTHT